jgi:hypothetical protein
MSKKLKVGDFVKVVKTLQTDISKGVQLGGVFRVSHVDSHANAYIETGLHAALYMTPSQFVRVQPSKSEFEGFKVGDIVVRTANVHASGMLPGMPDVITDVAFAGQSIGDTQLVSLMHFPGQHYASSLKVVARDDPTPVAKLNDGARLPSSLPNDSVTRKEYPLAEVLFGQFPAACVAVAHHSYKGNKKHNPGKPLQDNRTLSNDDASCIMRHLMEGDYEGVAWRAMRLLQKKLEEEGAPVAPLATFE